MNLNDEMDIRQNDKLKAYRCTGTQIRYLKLIDID